MKIETQRECHVKTEDWNDTSTSQRTPKIAGKPLEARKRQEARRRQGRIPLQLPQGACPCC